MPALVRFGTEFRKCEGDQILRIEEIVDISLFNVPAGWDIHGEDRFLGVFEIIDEDVVGLAERGLETKSVEGIDQVVEFRIVL